MEKAVQFGVCSWLDKSAFFRLRAKQMNASSVYLYHIVMCCERAVFILCYPTVFQSDKDPISTTPSGSDCTLLILFHSKRELKKIAGLKAIHISFKRRRRRTTPIPKKVVYAV